jgi:DNA repair exonuclease SbcCD nuclease subunit
MTVSKVVILGDTHIGARGDSLLFHEYFRKFYDNVFFPFLKENNINIVIQMGDLFDRRKFINFNSLYLARQYFFNKIKENNIEFHTLLGNHDVSFKNTLEVNSSSLLLKDYDCIKVYEDFTTLELFDIPLDVVPWICDDNEQEIFEKIRDSKSQICLGHFEIDGFEMDRGNVHHGGLDKVKLNKYDIVLTGHFHHKSTKGNITYVGTPYEMTWSDYNDTKGFHVFDLHTRELQFIENPYTMFHKISYDDTEKDFEYWKNYDYEKLKDSYVKIIVVNKSNPYLFDSVLDNLYKADVADVSIVEDFSEMDINNDEELINQAEDTMTILSHHIDGLTLNVESDKLKKLMRELYVEALNTEVTE